MGRCGLHRVVRCDAFLPKITERKSGKSRLDHKVRPAAGEVRASGNARVGKIAMTPHENAHSEITKKLAISSRRPGSQSPRARSAAVAALAMGYATSHATHGRIQEATPKIGFFGDVADLQHRWQHLVTPSSNEKEISHGRVSWHLEAVEPAALVGGVEHTARNQCVDPSGEIVRAGE